MAGVFGQLLRPQKEPTYRYPKIMELEAAKEILAEVFKYTAAQPGWGSCVLSHGSTCPRGLPLEGREGGRGW